MQVLKDTTFEVGHKVWQVRPPQPSLTVVVKATFTLVPDGTCEIADEQQPVTGDALWDEDPEQSVRLDGDLAVMKPRGECFLAGTCHPPQRPTTVSAVSFRVGSIAKRLAIFGDRRWQKGLGSALPSQPLPFNEMPLRWERSFGGPGVHANPVGAGLGEQLPNIEDPAHLVTSPSSRPHPAGAFPIPLTWKSRMKLSGTYGDEWQKTRWPYFPKDFDWAFFNAAPEDQRIDGYWRGDEEIELVNLHPKHARIATRLPGLVARLFLVSEKEPFREVPLRLDTLSVDADAETVCCVWRGLMEVASEKLTEIQDLFVLHAPLEASLSVDACRERYEQKLREKAEAEEELEPELPPKSPPNALPEVPGLEVPSEVVAQTAASALGPLAVPDAPSAETAQAEEADDEQPPDIEDPHARERVVQMLADEVPLAGEDLTGADLSGLCFDGVDLSEVLLAGANLENATFEEAKLDGALLAETRLSGARFTRASLTGVDLTAATGERVIFDGAVLENALASEAHLPDSSFVEANLSQTELVEATMPRADFSKAKLDGADLSRAKLDHARFVGASLINTRLEGADATAACFDEAKLDALRASDGAIFAQASLKRTSADGSRWGGSRLDEANFSFSSLERADFSEASLVKAVFAGCKLVKARFPDARLWGASLVQANVMEGDFEAADLTDADLRGANLFGGEFWQSKLERTRFELANLNRTKLADRK